MAPEDLILDADGRPARIDKAFSWEAPIAAHGMMHMVIANAWKGDPYPIDTLFMYMANMAWNSAMNTAETMRMLTDKDPATGEYRIPRIIYSDAYYSETVAYADLVLPDTTYLERWDCISLLDRPIGGVDGPGDAIRQPVVEPDRDVRPFQDVLIELGARLGLPGFVDAGRRAALSRRLSGLHRQSRAPAGRRPAGAAGAAPTATEPARGAPNPHQLERYVANGCFWKHELPPEQLYFKHANKAYLETAVAMGFIDAAAADRTAALCRAAAALPPRRPRARRGRAARASTARASPTYFDPLPFWYMPFEEARVDRDDIPAARADPAADARCIIPGTRRTPGCARSSAITGCS